MAVTFITRMNNPKLNSVLFACVVFGYVITT